MRSSEYREGYDKGYDEGHEKARQEAREAIGKIPHRSASSNDPELQKQYLADDKEVSGVEPTEGSSEHPPIYTALTLDERIKNCFTHANIHTLEQLLQYSPKKLLKIRNFGPDSLRKVKQELSVLSLSLANEQ